MQQALNPNSSQLYWSIQEDVGKKTIERILRNPDKLVQHLRWNAGFVTMKIAYGYTIQDEDDHFIAIAEEASKIIAVASAPGKWLVDSIPICTRTTTHLIPPYILKLFYSATHSRLVSGCYLQKAGE